MIQNGIELQTMTFNGQEVDTWIHNGVEVYSGFTPFYVIENGFLVDGNYTSANRIVSGGYDHQDKNYGSYGINAITGATVSFKSDGAKTLTIKADSGGYTANTPKLTVVADGNSLLAISSTNYNNTVNIEGYENVTVTYQTTTSNGFSSAKITEIYCEK